MGQAPAGAPGPPRAAQRHRLPPSGSRQRLCGGQKGGSATGSNPTDRGKAGTKRHIITDAQGIPLAVRLTGANVHDSVLLEEVIDAVPPIRQSWGLPRRRPSKLHADKAYDHRRCRRALTRRHILPRIARCGIESSARLGRHRWVEAEARRILRAKIERLPWHSGCSPEERRRRIEADVDQWWHLEFLVAARRLLDRHG
jgi:IS5 family transposase